MSEQELKPCPCGKTPERLGITDGSTYRWRYVSCPCSEWSIEARVDLADRNDPEAIYAECVRAWNIAPRHDEITRLTEERDRLLDQVAGYAAEVERLRDDVAQLCGHYRGREA